MPLEPMHPEHAAIVSADYDRYADLIEQARRAPAGSDTEAGLLEQAHTVRRPHFTWRQYAGDHWSYLDTATQAVKAGRDIDEDLKFFRGRHGFGEPAESDQQRHRAQAHRIAERHAERPQRGIERSR